MRKQSLQKGRTVPSSLKGIGILAAFFTVVFLFTSCEMIGDLFGKENPITEPPNDGGNPGTEQPGGGTGGGTIIYSENYESYSVNSLPPDYIIHFNGAGNSEQRIEREANGNRYLRTSGQTNWAAAVRKDFDSDFPDKISVTIRMRMHVPYGHLYIRNAAGIGGGMGIRLSNGKMLLACSEPGGSQPEIQRDTWNTLRFDVDFANRRQVAYLNGTKYCEWSNLGTIPRSHGWSNKAGIQFHSSNNARTVTWFDDIVIRNVTNTGGNSEGVVGSFVKSGDFGVLRVNVDNLENDLVGSVASIMPAGYKVGDWNDLTTFSNSGNDLKTLWDNLGAAEFMLTRNGDTTAYRNVSDHGTRFHAFYFAQWSERPGRTPHSGFHSFGNLGQLYLGSFIPGGRLLIVKESYGGGTGSSGSSAQTVTDGSSVAASLSSSGERDRYAVALSAGQTLTAYTTGSTDTFGTFEDSGGTSLATNDDGGSGRNFRIAHTVSAAGTYYIIVSGYRNATGSYRLHVAISAASAAGRFRVSLSTVDATGSTDGVAAQACQSDFGSGYDVAAWEDIKRVYAATPTGDRPNFITNSLGLSGSNSLLVKRSNSEIYSGRRHYTIDYHNGSVPGHYLQHDNIDNSTISLGSWYVTLKALCYGS